MSNIIPIIAFQDEYYRRLVCISCGFQDGMYVPELIKSNNIKCPGCNEIGYVVWWGDNDYEYSK